MGSLLDTVFPMVSTSDIQKSENLTVSISELKTGNIHLYICSVWQEQDIL